MVASSWYSADMLAPALRSCEFASTGPYTRSRADPRKDDTQMITKYLRYKRLMVILSEVLLARSIGLIIVKYLFARHLLGGSSTDLVRALVSTISTRVIDRRRHRINAAFEIFDRFPHNESAGQQLSWRILLVTTLLWCYIGMRIAVDMATFFIEPDRFQVYVETELLMNVERVTSTSRPLIYLVATIDMVLNRLVISAALINIFFLYIFINFVTNLKFRKFDEDILYCASRDPVDPVELRNLRLRHAELCDLIIHLDDIFSPLAIFWHGSVVIGLCTESVNLIQRFSGGRGAGVSLLTMTQIFLNTIYIVANLSFVTVATSLVCECKDRSEHIVRNMLYRPQTQLRLAAHQMRLLATQMNISTVQMTAFRFYNLNRSAFMTVMGAAVTYVSFVAQTAHKVTSEE